MQSQQATRPSAFDRMRPMQQQQQQRPKNSHTKIVPRQMKFDEKSSDQGIDAMAQEMKGKLEGDGAEKAAKAVRSGALSEFARNSASTGEYRLH